MSESAREALITRGPGPRGAFAPWKEKNYTMLRNDKKGRGSVARKQNKTSSAVYTIIRNVLNNAITGQPFPWVPDKRLLPYDV